MRTVRSSRRHSRPGRPVRSSIVGAGSGSGGGFALKGVSQVEGTPLATSLALPGDPQAGDLAVIFLEGSGGVANHYEPSAPAGWTSVSGRTSSGRIIHKILGEGETTGPTAYTDSQADGHAYMAVFSGAVFTSGGWMTLQENTGGILTGSGTTQRVVNLPAAATAGDFVMLEAGGSSGAAEFAGTVTTDWTDETGTFLFDGRDVTFNHAQAGSIFVSDGATTAFTFSGLDANFNFNSNSAFRGGYAIISPA